MTMQEPMVDWLPDIERRTRLARLSVFPPEAVYAEMRVYASEVMASTLQFGDDQLEKSLLKRGDLIIDLALASFGSCWEVVAELYNRSFRSEYADEAFRNGLRVACLANRAVLSDSRIWNQMTKAIEPDLPRLLTEGDDAEVGALLSNEEIYDRLLEALYERTDQFSTLSDERWLRLIGHSAKNARLGTRQDSEDGPDIGHYAIQKAIFSMLEKAPVSIHSLRTLYNLLDQLDSTQVFKPEAPRLREVLRRWSALEVTNHKGETDEGYHTTLSIADEFRCIVAALFSKDYGDRSSTDVAERCGYYASAKLTAKDIRTFLKRGPEAAVFSLVVIYNDHVLHNRKLRAVVEDLCGGGDFAYRYKRRCQQIHRGWPSFDPEPTEEWLKEPNDKRPEDALKGSITSVESQVRALAKRVDDARTWLVVGLIALAAFIEFRNRM
jgi:hypothetical protein